ncbi:MULTISPECIES: sensor histidine kinase [unclassified Candidatus Frackibacter]|uniref:sensor histidine kinase n=1 Tax=unclassified Candidatus Frackibacter TaxID=2648818 RepID=UPI000B7E25ED|nr:MULTISPECIES: ATP-binding protein [unclassified Candidatus Frackibacter]
MMKRSTSKLKYVVFLLLIQSFWLLMTGVWRGLDIINLGPKFLLDIILFIAVGLSVFSIIMIKEIFKVINKEMQFKIQKIELKEKEKLNKNLRIQKHDFANHLQTIYGMIQLEKEDEVKAYIQDLNHELANTKLYQNELSNSVLDSILIPKKLKAMQAGIQFNCQIEDEITGVQMSLKKIFRIVSNLIDNAIDATKDFNSKDKLIKVLGKYKGNEYVLSVYNSGPIIEKNLLTEILKPGFSTKGEDRGFGLYIIKSLIEENDGRLEIKSEKRYGTEFICYLPRERKSERKAN